MNDAVADHHAIGTDHLRHRQCRSDLHRRDAGLLQFRRNRSTAARAGASRGREDDRVHSQALGLLGHFSAHAARVR
jgi:hypothetical protein